MQEQKLMTITSMGQKRMIGTIGFLLIFAGFVFLAANVLKTDWLPLIIAPITGLGMIVTNLSTRKIGYIIAGSLLIGTGVGVAAALSGLFNLNAAQQTGIILAGFCASWLMMAIIARVLVDKLMWWPLIPAIVVGSLSACFCFSSLRFLDFVLYLGVAIGFALLAPGLYFKLWGLIIPGCLILAASIAVFAGWAVTTVSNPLAQTGMMLVVFSLGWGLISLCGRMITEKFVWWPLIPGGILAMTGWGLYIGGDPNNALSFIGNTGSIGLIIFGVYLLLLRRGLHR